MAPIRLGNLCALDLEQNLVRPGRGKQLHLVIEATDVKNRHALEFPLPPQSIELVERYLREFRPHLAAPGCTALFPGRSGGSKGTNTLGGQISKTIRSYTGIKMHPHLFRHVTAKIYLDANPGGYEVVQAGARASFDRHHHRLFLTGQETAAAIRHFDHTILEVAQE